jgi:hypothetical protein
MTAVLSDRAEPRGASVFLFNSVRNPNTAPHRCGIGNNSGVKCDPYAIRRKHPEHWMAFLHAHFPDVLTVRWTFGVDDQTARNWWHGKVQPQGWAVEFAIKAIPNAAQWLEAA